MARSRTAGKQRIADWLLLRIGEVVTTDEIYAASGGMKSYARRVRELRAEGWPIQSGPSDAPDLKPGEYRLTGRPPKNPVPRFGKRISNSLRAQVLDRNHGVCRLCGITADDHYDDGRKVRLHVDHIQPESNEGDVTLENLRTLCSRCNEGAKNTLNRPPNSLLWLKGKVRTASLADQREIYNFLQSKFGGKNDETS